MPGERGRRDGGVFNRLGGKGKSVSAHSESRYQSSRSERTKFVPKKRHHEGTCSRRTEMLSESEDSRGGHWKSKSKKQKSSIEEDDLSQRWVCEETDPFTPRIRYFELPKKTRMPSNVKTYDGSDDPKDHLKNSRLLRRWSVGQCRHDATCSILHSLDPLGGEVAASNQARKKTLPAWRHQQIEELIKARKLLHVIKELKQGSGNDRPKAPEKELHKASPPNPEISFPPLGDEDGTKGPMIIEAPSRSKEPNGSGYRTPHWFQRRDHMANGKNIASSKNRGCGALNLYLDEFCGGILTLWSSKIIPLECIMVFGNKAQPSAITQAAEERIKVIIHPEYPKQTVAIGSTLTEEERKASCGLLRRNLDIFAWKPEDITGVPRYLAKNRMNVRDGCPPVRQKKRGAERKKAIQEEVERLVEAGILKEVHYHS
nr:reverse transcriptase domain-containing protein [Tanacetum cinerariifolium]